VLNCWKSEKLQVHNAVKMKGALQQIEFSADFHQQWPHGIADFTGHLHSFNTEKFNRPILNKYK
jgi:hypothetical protein